MEQNARLSYLLERLAAHTATDEELDELTAMVDGNVPGATIEAVESWLEANRPLPQPAYDHDRWMEVAGQILEADKLREDPETLPVQRVHYLHRWGWAAAIILLFATGAWFFNHYGTLRQAPIAKAGAPLDVNPGRNGAVLTLGDGSQIELDSAGNAIIPHQNGTVVTLDNNALQYTPESDGPGEVKYNTITTARGRQFTVRLPDGTKVWLNAASSLRFPVVFKGKERIVEFTGEAYFEVAKNALQPFRLKVPGRIDIDVLGTAFNVNAYTNEHNSYATLVEGAVRVSLPGNSGGGVVLQPGEQVQADLEKMEVLRNANVDKAIAWKNGLFNFEGAGLREMMRQLERWYDLEVVYEGNVPEIQFFGEMSRSLKLSDVLAGLESADVHFRLEAGRKLVVMP